MSRVCGRYPDGRKCEYRDFLKDMDGRTVNLLEINDDGNFVTAPLDENGEYHFLDVYTREPFMVDFVRRWDDIDIIIGAGI